MQSQLKMAMSKHKTKSWHKSKVSSLISLWCYVHFGLGKWQINHKNIINICYVLAAISIVINVLLFPALSLSSLPFPLFPRRNLVRESVSRPSNSRLRKSVCNKGKKTSLLCAPSPSLSLGCTLLRVSLSRLKVETVKYALKFKNEEKLN